MRKKLLDYYAALPPAARIAQLVLWAMAVVCAIVLLILRLWPLVWLPYPVAAVLCSLVRATTLRKQLGYWPLLRGLVWTFTLYIYIKLSVNTGAWRVTWLIFLIGICLTGAAHGALRLRTSKKQWLKIVLFGLLALALTATLAIWLVLHATGL